MTTALDSYTLSGGVLSGVGTTCTCNMLYMYRTVHCTQIRCCLSVRDACVLTTIVSESGRACIAFPLGLLVAATRRSADNPTGCAVWIRAVAHPWCAGPPPTLHCSGDFGTVHAQARAAPASRLSRTTQLSLRNVSPRRRAGARGAVGAMASSRPGRRPPWWRS